MLLMLACNGHRNGLFTGHFQSACFDFGSGFSLHVECIYADAAMKCAEFSEHGISMLRVGKKTVRVYSRHEWLGNWRWNGYIIRPRHGAMLLSYLRATKGFRLDSGASSLWELWRSGEAFTVQSIRQAYRKSEAEMGR